MFNLARLPAYRRQSNTDVGITPPKRSVCRYSPALLYQPAKRAVEIRMTMRLITAGILPDFAKGGNEASNRFACTGTDLEYWSVRWAGLRTQPSYSPSAIHGTRFRRDYYLLLRCTTSCRFLHLIHE